MAIRTHISPFLFYRDILIAVACAFFGAWGWYAYAVRIPNAETAFAEYVELQTAKDGFEKRVAKNETLSQAEQAEFIRVKQAINDRFKETPAPPPTYDRAVQLWVYVVGCGVLGTPWALWSLLSLRRRSFQVTDDGMLVTPEGTCRLDAVHDIDMSRWMSKSIAVVTLENGATSVMDDYKYKQLHLIVGAIAHRLYPDQWTAEAKVAKRKGSGDAAEVSDTEDSNTEDSSRGAGTPA